MILATTWKILVFLHQNTKVGMHSRVIYCTYIVHVHLHEEYCIFNIFTTCDGKHVKNIAMYPPLIVMLFFLLTHLLVMNCVISNRHNSI